MPKKTIRSVDLFCGAGGLTEGLRLAGIKTVAANDIDPWAGASYADNHRSHGAKFVLGDIRQASVRKELLHAVGGASIDLVAGGPPCQAFSQVRNHDRSVEDPRNALYRQFLRMVRELDPKAFVMENVVGIRNIQGGDVGERIKKELSLGGRYRVRWNVLDAADFGVPQTRPRVVAIGIRDDLGVDPPAIDSPLAGNRMELVRLNGGKKAVSYELPQEQGTLGQTSILQQLLDPECLNYVSVSQALDDLIPLRAAERLVRKPSDDAVDYPREATSAYQRWMRGDNDCLYNADVPSIREDTVKRLLAIPHGGNFRDIPADLQARYLNGKKWGPDVGKATLSRKHYYAYRKLHPDFFSWTLNTKTDCVYHYAVPRALSVREFARLHSFPDRYTFLNGDRHSRYAQIGNAVPPLLAKGIADALLPILRKRPRAANGRAATAP